MGKKGKCKQIVQLKKKKNEEKLAMGIGGIADRSLIGDRAVFEGLMSGSRPGLDQRPELLEIFVSLDGLGAKLSVGGRTLVGSEFNEPGASRQLRAITGK